MLLLRITLQSLTGLLALLSALLDYGEHDRSSLPFKRRRALVVCGIIIICAMGLAAEIVSEHSAADGRSQAKVQSDGDAKRITALRASIDAEQLAHRRESEQALKALDQLQQRFAELQAKVTTASLQAELQTYATELRRTRQVLSTPKAKFAFHFGDSANAD